MKNLRHPAFSAGSAFPGPIARVAGLARLARLALLLLLLLALAVPLPVLAEAPASGYDSLRLFTEALYEISQKYVYPKTDDEMIYGSIRGMVNSLDPDSSFLTPSEYQSYKSGSRRATAEAGVEVIAKDNLLTLISVLDDGPGAAAGLKPGDHVLKIDGQVVRNLSTQEAARRFRGAPGTALKLEVMHNGAVKPQEITVTLQPLSDNTVTAKIIGDSYGYLRLRFFNDTTPKELDLALKSLQKQAQPLRGLILDLRNNARGSLEQAVRSASLFLGDKEVVTARGRTSGSQETFEGKGRDLVLKNPVPTVVLVDQDTARAAEIMAAALRDQYQATLLGTQTFGLAGLTKPMPLQDGSALVMTVAQCFSPKGQKIQGKGLEPAIQGQAPKENAPEAALPRGKTPEEDPWVQQALEVLKGGKRAQIARQTQG